MISTLRSFMAVAVLVGGAAFAQTPQDHEAHHPAGETGAPPTAAAPEATQGQMPGQSSGMGQGMMGPNMMAGGMMGGTGSGGTMGGMGAGGMMDGPGMMYMMNMMGMMGARPGAAHIEGRLAFISTELKITDAQMPQWNAFADAVRANAKAMSEMHQSMAPQQNAAKTLPERLAFEDQAMTAHLDALKRTEAALDKLYATLSTEQKKIADQIIVGPMGMPMGMM